MADLPTHLVEEVIDGAEATGLSCTEMVQLLIAEALIKLGMRHQELIDLLAPLVAAHTAPSVGKRSPPEGSTIIQRAGCVPTESASDIPCACGCGGMVKIRPAYFSPACRVRAKRKRDKK